MTSASSLPVLRPRGVAWPWWVGAVLALGVGVTAWRYLIPGAPGAAPNVLANRFAHVALPIHAGFAGAALVLGPWQFLPRLRRSRRGLHRWLGRSYVVCCLVAAGAGLVLAAGASTGPISTAGFGALALTWIGVNIQGWRAALRRDFQAHRRWMIRSWALTLAAVTLRLYLPVALFGPFGFEGAYRAISFLCWVPNLAAAEVWLRRRSRA